MKSSPLFTFLIITFLLSAVIYSAKEDVTIPVKKQSIKIERSKDDVILGASEAEVSCENRLDELENQLSLIDWAVLLVLLIAVSGFFGLCFMLLRNRVVLGRKMIMKSLEKSVNPLRDQLAQKEKEIRMLKASMMNMDGSAADQEAIDKLEQELIEKEDSVIQLINEISSLKEQMDSGSVGSGEKDSEITKLKEELNVVSKEKIEFLEMIENLQKQISERAPSAGQEASETPGEFISNKLESETITKLNNEIADLKEELKHYTQIPTRKSKGVETEITEDQLSQLSGFLNTLNEAANSSGSEVISQDLMDSLLAQNEVEGKMLTKDEIAKSSDLVNKLLKETKIKNETTDAPKDQSSAQPPEPAGALSQDALDSLFDGGGNAPEPKKQEPAPAGALSQDDLDALLDGGGGNAPTPEPKKQEPEPTANGGGALSQNDLDALFDGGGSAPTAEPKKQEPPPAANGGGGALSQNDLDALLDGGGNAPAPATAPKKQEPTPANGGGGALSQNDLDALLDGGGNAPAPATAPKKQEPTPTANGGGGALSQNDLDALLDGGGNAPAPATAPKKQEPTPANGGGGALSQNDLDALLDGGGNAPAPATAPKKQEPTPAANGGGGALSQDDLDNLFK